MFDEEKFLLTYQNLSSDIDIQKIQFKETIHKNISKVQSKVDKISTFIYRYLEKEIKEFLKKDSDKLIIIYPIILYDCNDIAPNYGLKIEILYTIFLYSKKMKLVYQIDERNILQLIKEFNEKYSKINLSIKIDWDEQRKKIILNHMEDKYGN